MRYLNQKFIVAGVRTDDHERIFGRRAKKWCDDCGKLLVWCECPPVASDEGDAYCPDCWRDYFECICEEALA